MKREACITFPPNEPILLIRASYILLCDGDTCCAALLSVFQYWHEVKLASREQARAHNAAASAAGQSPDQDESCWVYKSAEELVDDLLGMYKDKSVRAALKKLIDAGFIQQRRNPRFQFDNKPQYLFVVDKVQEGVAKMTTSTRQKRRADKGNGYSAKTPRRSGKNAETIPEITIPQITHTENTSAPSGAPPENTESLESHSESNAPSPGSAPPPPAVQPHIALIDAWLGALPGKPAIKDIYKRYCGVAAPMAQAGITPEQVAAYTAALRRDGFWKGRLITLEYVAANIAVWLADQAPAKPARAPREVTDADLDQWFGGNTK